MCHSLEPENSFPTNERQRKTPAAPHLPPLPTSTNEEECGISADPALGGVEEGQTANKLVECISSMAEDKKEKSQLMGSMRINASHCVVSLLAEE